MDSAEFDRRVEVVEEAMYSLKESGYANFPDIVAIDNFLAITAELKVELYYAISADFVYHNPNVPAIQVVERRGFSFFDMILACVLVAIITATVAFVEYHYWH